MTFVCDAAGRPRAVHAVLLAIVAAACAVPAPIGAAVPSAIDWCVGAWRGVRRDAHGEGAAITVTVERLGDGNAQIERLQVDGNPPYVGFAVRTPTGPGRWSMRYANSTRSSIAHLRGDTNDAEPVWQTAATDAMRRSSMVWQRIEADHWRRTQRVSEDGGATWHVLFTDDLERADGGG